MLVGPLELFNHTRIPSEVLLTADEHDGQARTEMLDLSNPLCSRHQSVGKTERMYSSTCLLLHVVERVGRVNRKADEDDMRVRIRERSQSVIVFLTRSVPESELDVSAIDIYLCHIVLEDSRHVNLARCRQR